MNSLRIACIVVALGLGACASQGPYTPAEDAGDYGYYSTPLGDNRYRIVFNGNGTTGENSVKDYALFRAAELTMQQGKDWFQVVNRESSAREKPGRASVARHDTTYVVDRDCGLLGCSTRMRPVMHTTIGVDTSTGRTTYSSTLEIVMGNDPMPASSGSYYDADTLMKALWDAM